ncbi:aerolysin family beta-barrel pore-forming toxin [Clostridiaceae bacterium M8S5]|nr:aerolysin family beta-barrel pore-forming toxin [Clostridiaceae bacterium M8S5]
MKTKSSLSKKVLYLFMSVCMVFNLMPWGSISYASSPATNTSFPSSTMNYSNFKDEQDLISKVINNRYFIKNNAIFANYLGIAWCSGTASQYVGDDFSFKKDGDKYILQANYNKHDPYASGYWADKRLKMTVSNVRFHIDTDSIKLGKEKVTKLDPVMLQSCDAVNKGNTEDSSTVSFTYTKDKTVSHSFTYSFEEGIQVNSTATIDVKFVSASCNYGWSFKSGQSWTNSTATASSVSATTSYDAKIPAKSKRTIKLMSFKTKSDVPYTATIYMDYDITYSGFLKYSGNARADHPRNRPFVNITFGDDHKSAQEAIRDMYDHKDINGYSNWDWNWMEKQATNDKQNFQDILMNVCQLDAADINGTFTCVDGTHVVIQAGDAVALTDEELASASNNAAKSMLMTQNGASNQQSKGITIENTKFNDTPQNKVTKSSVTTSTGTVNLR